MEKVRESQKNIYFCLIDYAEVFDYVDHNKLWEILRDGKTRPPYLSPEEPVCRSKKQQLELNMEQQTGSNLGKEYDKVVYCHLAYLIYMQNTGWITSWNQDCWEK